MSGGINHQYSYDDRSDAGKNPCGIYSENNNSLIVMKTRNIMIRGTNCK